ncbi:uncharacterized protein LOC143609907 [Bidens hawaiensis]|uniref:uncharacterized protein LOC143609907 n=1 Tax=Bidens hawaiensis TaxID=980011 RepID=UPI00404A9780
MPCFYALPKSSHSCFTNKYKWISLGSPLEFSPPMEFNSIHHSLSKFPSHPLFSTIITLYALLLLYAPPLFFRIALSPVLNSTGIILLFLLKLGANQRLEKESNVRDHKHYLEPRVVDHKDKHYEQLPSLEQRFLDLVDRNQKKPESESNSQDDYAFSMESTQVVEKEDTRMEMETKEVDTTMKFTKWNLKAPLEIIYEEYEGEEEEEEEDEDDNGNMVFRDKQVLGFEGYLSLSMYYPESETDSSSDGDFSINENWETHKGALFKWEKEDDEREELIEISVDRYENNCIEFSGAEEDNLIEIDILPWGN